MKYKILNNKKVVLFATLVILILASIYMITRNRSNRSSEVSPASLSHTFAKALRENDPILYEITATNQKSRIDEWLSTHKVKDCDYIPDEQFRGGGSGRYWDDYFYCYMADEAPYFGLPYDFKVHDIEIERVDGQYIIVNWGEVIEKFDLN